MSDHINQEQSLAAVLAATTEIEGKKTLPCTDALRIASELGVEPITIGKICDAKQIKITTCQLGCFD